MNRRVIALLLVVLCSLLVLSFRHGIVPVPPERAWKDNRPAIPTVRWTPPLAGCTPVDPSRPSLVCPAEGYHGLTNMMINAVHCVLMAATACPRVDAYLPMRIQHATFFDLFDSVAMEALQRRLNITIMFFCDEEAVRNLKAVEFGKNITMGKAKKKCVDVSGPRRVSDAYDVDLFPTFTVAPLVLALVSNPSLAVRSVVRKVQSSLNDTRYTAVHIRLESDLWTLTGGKGDGGRRRGFGDTLSQLARHIPRGMETYGTGRPVGPDSAKWNVRYKRDFLDDSPLVAPYPTLYRRSGRVANITNSTGALVDFILLLEATATLTARYSSFGTYVAVLRCISRRGVGTYVYGAGSSSRLVRVIEACSYFEGLMSKAGARRIARKSLITPRTVHAPRPRAHGRQTQRVRLGRV